MLMVAASNRRVSFCTIISPFSVGETDTGGRGRREIVTVRGGALPRTVVPVKTTFAMPFVYRVNHGSNGSTSMASVCAGMLALMDAGVPVKTRWLEFQSAGYRVYRRSAIERYELLTDIIGRKIISATGILNFAERRWRHGFQLDLKLPV